MHQLFVEYESLNSAEARFVKAIDKIQPLLTNVYTKGLTWKENKTNKETITTRIIETLFLS